MTKEQAKKELWKRGNINTLGKADADELIDLIFKQHEEEILKLKKHDRLMRDKAHEFNAKVGKLEAICEELFNLPKGVESHSWSDYKMQKENK